MSNPLNKRELTASMVIGFLIGLPVAGMIAGFVAWVSLQRHAAELAGEFGLSEAVIVTETIEAGKPLDISALAKRPVPRLVASPNTVAPDEVNELIGQSPKVGFEKGDLLLRSAFGLAPRQAPEAAEAAE
ncbi:hypothetical protein [Vulgatibacter incomptus]|uniref:Uncharacterized protein n=1 Tax=Vulgatibacter incomptus TaxID=1391653 RepID=A0A0K1PAS2_9BACT|nr:hypothetical protein [Vulgatibacter incomptus]AKU90602.1 hypothetical protein AKJ08_0989 [Vulgatibacter incomptus]